MASSSWSQVGSRDKMKSLFIKSWAFWTECYRVIIWLSIVTRDSRLVPVDKRLAPWAVVADGEGWWSKVYFYIKVTVKSVNSVSLFPFWSFSHLQDVVQIGKN